MKAKISAQAQTVLDILAAKRCHLTADEILEGWTVSERRPSTARWIT